MVALPLGSPHSSALLSSNLGIWCPQMSEQTNGYRIKHFASVYHLISLFQFYAQGPGSHYRRHPLLMRRPHGAHHGQVYQYRRYRFGRFHLSGSPNSREKRSTGPLATVLESLPRQHSSFTAGQRRR